MSTILGLDEDLPVSRHDDVYPTIDPEPHFSAQTYRGKIVLITGASRGIGADAALAYARAGASVAILARSQKSLDERAAEIRSSVPGAQVLVVPADVRDVRAVDDAVRATLSRFQRIDIVIANAGALTLWNHLHAKDPDGWWNTFEVNIRGIYNTLRSSVTGLQASSGYFIAVSSVGAQLRIPGASDYCISKHTINRLVEFIAIEYPQIKTFSFHPGEILTEMQKYARGVNWSSIKYDSQQLPTATMLFLTSGRMDWLNGRFVSANWDLGEVERDMKARIVDGGGLVNKLCIPP